MKNKFLIILILGIILRLLLAASTFHPDLRTFQFSGMVVASGHILDIYDYIFTLPISNPITKMVVFNYPPAIYFFHGIFNFIFSNILGLHVINDFIIERASDFGNWQFNLYLLLLKLPYIIFDLLTAFMIIKLFDNPKQKFLAFTLWIFNPINLYATYMMGQFDVIPVFFTVLSLYFVKINKLNWAAFTLSFGAAFKIYPLFLLIPLAFISKDFMQKIKIILLGILPYVLSITPFISSRGFRSTALVAEQTSKSLYAQVAISGGESLMLFPILLVFIYLIFYFRKGNTNDLWKRNLIVLLLFFAFTHYHPQWFLWLTPFFILELVYSEFKGFVPVILALISFLGLLFLFESSLTVNIFAPLFPNLYNLPSIWQLLRINVDYHYLRSIFQSIFAASAVYLIYIHFPKHAKD